MSINSREQILTLESDIRELENILTEKKLELARLRSISKICNKLTNDEISRYSRQIILPEIGVAGQLKLKASSVLIVGAGGLGSPAALYLACSGIGKLGIIDYDVVEINNLHRQVLHGESTLNMPKAISAKLALLNMNSSLIVEPYEMQLNSVNALDVIENYDVILDCSDNVATRYLLNDACVIAKKPLISGSALQLEGQLTVYNYEESPCYRCLFPTPPPPEAVTNCGDGGVLGAGIIGSLQALEALKILLNMPNSLAGRLLIFDGAESTFRNVKLRRKRPECEVCSNTPKITKLIDYEQFCGMKASDKDLSLTVLQPTERISVEELKQIQESKNPHILIDVRSPLEFEICHIEHSINIPLRKILENQFLDDLKKRCRSGDSIFVLCRRGNDSQIAVKHLRKQLNGLSEPKDVIGGLHAWHNRIDNTFPIY